MEQEQTLRDMWTSARTQTAIYKAVGKTHGAVDVKVIELGLPLRKSGSKLVAGNDSKFKSVGKGEAIRTCMCCRNTFHSDGIHNRLCRYCQSLA